MMFDSVLVKVSCSEELLYLHTISRRHKSPYRFAILRDTLEQLERDYKAEELRPFGADAVNQARYLEHYARCPVYTNTYTHLLSLGMMCFPPCWRSCGRRKSISSWNTSLLAPAYSGILWWRF